MGLHIRTIFIACMLLSTFWSNAQDCNGSLQGRVLDQHDHSSLEYATIYIEEVKRGTVADSLGNYLIEGLCDGIFTARIEHVGCEPETVKVNVKGKTKQDFFPEHHMEELSAVQIVVERAGHPMIIPSDTVSAEKMEQARGLPLGEMLKSVEGVTSLQTGASISKPVIQGLHSSRVLIVNNGLRQEGQQWGAEHAPEIDPASAGRITVIKGAGSLRYGSDAMGGLIIVDPKQLRDSAGYDAEINATGSSNGRGGVLSGRFDGKFRKIPAFAWRVQGTLKGIGSVSAPDYVLANTGVRERNFSYSLAWKRKRIEANVDYSLFNTELGIFAASHTGNLSDLMKAIESPMPLVGGDFTYKIEAPNQMIWHELFKAKAIITTGNRSRLTLQYGRQYNRRQEFDAHGEEEENEEEHPAMQMELTTHSGDVVFDHHKGKLHSQIGLSEQFQKNTMEGELLIPNFRNNMAGIFLIESLVFRRWNLEAGARYEFRDLDVYRSYGSSIPIPHVSRQFDRAAWSIAAELTPAQKWDVKLQFSSAWRAPNVSELYSEGLHHGAAAIEYGDPRLRMEKAHKVLLHISRTDENLHLALLPYASYFDGFIYRNPDSAPSITVRGAFPSFHYKQAEAFFYGSDFSLNYQLQIPICLQARVSVVRAKNLDLNNWIPSMPSDRGEVEVKYQFKDRNAFANSYVSLGSTYVARQSRIPAGVDIASAPSAYMLMNLHAGTNIKMRSQQFTIGLSVYNLLNKSYRDYMDRFRYFGDAMGMNAMLRLSWMINRIRKP